MVDSTLSIKRMGMSVLSNCSGKGSKPPLNKHILVEMESGMGEFDDRESVSVELNPPVISPKFGLRLMQ